MTSEAGPEPRGAPGSRWKPGAYKLPIQRERGPTLYRLFLAQPQEWPASLYLLEGEETGRHFRNGFIIPAEHCVAET